MSFITQIFSKNYKHMKIFLYQYEPQNTRHLDQIHKVHIPIKFYTPVHMHPVCKMKQHCDSCTYVDRYYSTATL